MQAYEPIIKQTLSPKRYAHSLAVADKAEALAKQYGASPKAARTAALLHDICKEMPPEVQLQWALKSAIMLDSVQRTQSDLWHSLAGAEYCSHELAIADTQILNAIRYHTSAREDMSLLEKIIYLADLTSADRDYPDVDIMRKLVLQDLDVAIFEALKFTVSHLATHAQPICPDTYKAYQWYRLAVLEE